MKRFLSLILALTLLAGMITVPVQAAAKYRAPVSLKEKRIAELEQWLCGKYFTVNQKSSDCGKKTSGDSHGCANCDTVNIVKQKWFQNHFDSTVKTSQFVSTGRSCNGFAWFAAWYCSRANDKDTVVRDKNAAIKLEKVGKVAYSKASAKAKEAQKAFRKKIEALAEPGDFINFNSSHFGIYLSCNNEGVYIMDSNGDASYHCYVQKHTMPWNRIDSVTVSTMYSKSGKFCEHDSKYTNSGICGNCGAVLPNKNNNASVTTGNYTVNVSSYSIKNNPYKAASNVATVSRGTTVYVDRAVSNGFGNLWYHVKYDKKEGYIYNESLTMKTVIGSFSADALKGPGTLTEGGSFHISGNLKTAGCNISGVRAYFCASGGTSAISGTVTPTDKPGKNTYSLYNSNVDKGLSFEKLKPGTYRYCVEVSTSAAVNYGGGTTNTVKLYSPNFTVKAKEPDVKAPTISLVSSAPDSVRYRISQNTSGATLYYYCNRTGAWRSTGERQVELQFSADDTIQAYSELKGKKAYATKLSVHLPVLDPPGILADANGDGVAVTITGQSGTKLFYRLDDSQTKTYTGTFTLTSDHTVYAYAQKNGCITSQTEEAEIRVTAPDTPVLSCSTATDLPVGDTFAVTWPKDRMVKYYQVAVLRDGKTVKLDNQVQSQGYAYRMTESGVYTVTVCAVNAIGESGTASISATAHEPCKVTFLNWDDSVWVEQEVPYGKSAVRPATSPTRRGYTFDGWEGSYANVTRDVTVKAAFVINTYTVRFLDIDGTLLGSQQITYDTSIDSPPMEAKVHAENAGRGFGGWHVEYAAEDSNMDPTHVDSDMRLRAVTAWKNEDLPVCFEDLSVAASQSASHIFNGYIVTGRISTSGEKDLKVKLVVTLKNRAEDGTYKMIAATVVHVTVDADTSLRLIDGTMADGIFISTDGKCKADRAEITALSIEGDDRTGGMLSQTAYLDIPDSVIGNTYWSDWMTEEELRAQGYEPSDADVEAKTQYREQTNVRSSVTTGSRTPPEGYYYGSDNSYWGNWTGWSTSAVSASSTRQVETRQVQVTAAHTEYRYGTWYGNGKTWCCNCDSSLHKTYSEMYTSWSTTRVSPKSSRITCGYVYTSSHPHKYYCGQMNSGGYNSSTKKDCWYQYEINGTTYFWEQTRNVAATYRTEYRYCDYVPRYVHYTWNYGAWSEWGDRELTDPDPSEESYKVETRKLYRYQQHDVSELIADTAGKVWTLEGRLQMEEAQDRLVTVLVYKSKNTDPTASQLEYVGQTTLDADGGYSCSFRCRETPTPETGDFVVALAAEGGDGLVNVGVLPYERPKYTVSFVTDDGAAVSTVQVEEGMDAPLPEEPVKEGCLFYGWDGRTTGIRSDVIVTAKFIPLSHSAVFVDHVNGTCELRAVETGQSVECPEPPEAEGYEFLGWSGYEPGMTITEDTVFTARWNAVKYTVTFHNETGDVLSVQSVEYGESAVIQKDLAVAEGLEFLGWSDDACWWNVTEDIDVYPIISYKQTAAVPSSSLGSYYEGTQETLLLTAEQDAVICYTVDGTVPDPLIADEEGTEGTFLYVDGIELTESTLVCAVASAPDRNDSEPLYVSFHSNQDYSCLSEFETVEEAGTYQVELNGASEVEVEFSISGNPGLEGAVFFVDADPSIFGLADEPASDDAAPAEADESRSILPGAICEGNGSFMVEDYDPDYGWKIFWNGDRPATGDGTLFKLILRADNEITTGPCDITVRCPVDGVCTQTADACSLSEHLSVSVKANPSGAPAANPFTDVKEGAFYFDPVLWAVNRDPQITNGTGAASFSPDATCTRGQVVTFLWRAAGCPEPAGGENPFADVREDAFYYKAVLWAVEQEITKGTGADAFSPDQGCTRGQVVTFLHRFAGSAAPGSTEHPFTDIRDDAFYYEAVLWAVEQEITRGTSADAFSPNATCTRGQIVTFLYRAMDGK